MSTFIYFTEAAKAPVNRQRAEALGVGYAFDTSPASAELRGRTPSGGNGWLFADAERMGGKQLGYNQELQTWRRLPGLEVWVGYYNDSKPTPEDLERREQLAGRYIELSDGNDWLVPLLRFWSGNTGFAVALPTVAGIDENGDWISKGTSPQHDELNKLAERLLEVTKGQSAAALEGEDDPQNRPRPMTDIEMLEATCLLIGANYRVSKVELAELDALEIGNKLVQIGRIAIDLETVENWLKKKSEESNQAA